MGLKDPESNVWDRGPRRNVVRFDAIGEAWELLKQQAGVWLLTALVVIVANGFVTGAISSHFRLHLEHGFGGFRWPMPRAGTAVFIFVSALVNGFFVGGMFRMACRQIRGQRIGVADLLGVVDVLGELLLGSVMCAGAVAAVSLVCLVLPGLIVHGLLMFTLPLIVDRGLTAPAAMAASWRALQGQWIMAALFHVVVSFLSGLGSCFCGIGLLLTAPLYVLSIAVLYRDAFPVTGEANRAKPAAPAGDF